MATRLTTKPLVHDGAKLVRSTLGRYTEVGERTVLLETELGDYSYVVNDADIAYSRIGKFVSIAAHARINPGNHPMERASQSHFTYRASDYFAGEPDEKAFFQRRREKDVSIGHDVWIGHGAVVLPGRTIADGAVIAAGAIVTKDVGPYAIVAGNPARLVRPRFPPAVADRMRALAWWNWSHETLRQRLADFRSLPAEAFLERYEARS